MDKKTKYLLMFIIMLFGLAVMCCICRNINSSNKDDPVSVNERDLYRRNENDWTLSRHVRDAKVERPKKKKKRRAGKKKNKTGKGKEIISWYLCYYELYLSVKNVAYISTPHWVGKIYILNSMYILILFLFNLSNIDQ